MSFSTSRQTSGVMRLFYDSTHLFWESSSMSSSFDGSVKVGCYDLNAAEAAWKILRILAMRKPLALEMAVPLSDDSVASHSETLNDTEYENDDEHVVLMKGSLQEAPVEAEATDDEESILPSILGGLLMFGAVALDMAGII